MNTESGSTQASSEGAVLQRQLAAVLQRLEAIPQELADTEAKIPPARATLASVEERVEAKRQERQAALAEGRDVAGLTKVIAAIRAEAELAEDTIVGLEAKAATLRADEVRLQIEDRPRLQKAIAEQALRPLVAEYNRHAAALAEATQAIFLEMERWRQPLSWSSCPIFSVSSWEGFEVVPRLSFPGEPQGDFFNTSMVRERHRKAQVAELTAAV